MTDCNNYDHDIILSHPLWFFLIAIGFAVMLVSISFLIVEHQQTLTYGQAICDQTIGIDSTFNSEDSTRHEVVCEVDDNTMPYDGLKVRTKTK